jgi:hypothetical protein
VVGEADPLFNAATSQPAQPQPDARFPIPAVFESFTRGRNCRGAQPICTGHVLLWRFPNALIRPDASTSKWITPEPSRKQGPSSFPSVMSLLLSGGNSTRLGVAARIAEAVRRRRPHLALPRPSFLTPPILGESKLFSPSYTSSQLKRSARSQNPTLLTHKKRRRYDR